MTSFYRFPEIDIEDLSAHDQLWKISEELHEAVHAYNEYQHKYWTSLFDSEEIHQAYEKYLMEVMDIIHAAETLLHITDVDTKTANKIKNAVIEKNRKRGYYD